MEKLQSKPSKPKLTEDPLRWLNAHKGKIIVLIVCIIAFFTYKNTYDTGVADQNAVSSWYQQCQNVFSGYDATFKKVAGIQQANTAALDDVIAKAASGGYGQNPEFTPTSPFGVAVLKAYPDLNAVNNLFVIEAKVVQSGETNFQNCQASLLDHVRIFENFRQSFLVATLSPYIPGLKFPNDNFTITIGRQFITGMNGYNIARAIILTPDTLNAYQNGVRNDVP